MTVSKTAGAVGSTLKEFWRILGVIAATSDGAADPNLLATLGAACFP